MANLGMPLFAVAIVAVPLLNGSLASAMRHTLPFRTAVPTSEGFVAKKKTGMSKEHKEALARGRAQAKAVRDYLNVLERDGRKTSNMSPDQLNAKIHELQTRIDETDNPATRVELIQRRIDLEEQLNTAEDAPDTEALEKAFVEAVKPYSERKGISYMAWREVGVPAATLKAAGIPRTRRAAA